MTLGFFLAMPSGTGRFRAVSAMPKQPNHIVWLADPVALHQGRAR